jgi:medium-chain acyl-[acyl-carrier-protein] hydrolase
VTECAPGPGLATSPWFSRGQRAENARLRLFCFAHAGGGGSAYWALRRALAPDIDVQAVVLPGRESRIRETPCTRIEQLLGPLTEAVASRADLPYVLFGHSLGTLLAYEVARRLSVAGVPPLAMIASGRRGPWEPAHRHYRGLDDAQFLAAISELGGIPPEVLAQPSLLALVLPALRSDFMINDGYVPQPAATLRCPLAAYSGADDPEVSRSDLMAWERETSGEFAVRVFPGGHFYLRGARPDVVSALRADLGRYLDAFG